MPLSIAQSIKLRLQKLVHTSEYWIKMNTGQELKLFERNVSGFFHWLQCALVRKKPNSWTTRALLSREKISLENGKPTVETSCTSISKSIFSFLYPFIWIMMMLVSFIVKWVMYAKVKVVFNSCKLWNKRKYNIMSWRRLCRAGRAFWTSKWSEQKPSFERKAKFAVRWET